MTRELEINPKTARKLLSDIVKVGSQLVHEGSAIKLSSNHYRRNLNQNLALKLTIARAAANLIQSRTGVVAVAGSTVALAIKAAHDSGKTVNVMTNNMGVIEAVGCGQDNTVDLAGGVYRPAIHATVGPSVITAFKEFQCSAAVIGVSGIDDHGRLWGQSRDEPKIMQEAVDRAQDMVIIVADVSKFYQHDSWEFMNLSSVLDSKNGSDKDGRQFHLVTNSLRELEEFGDEFNKNQIEAAKRAWRRWRKIITVADPDGA